MDADKIESSYPLSPMQQGMLFHSLDARWSGVYVQQLVCSLHENLNVTAFRRAWQRLVERHSILRSGFRWKGSAEPLQETRLRISLPFEEQDWRELSAGEQEDRLNVYLQADRQRGFDLTQAPLLRLALFRLAETDYRFIWTSHHALLDGRSRLLVLKEFFALYEADCQGLDLTLERPRPYRDYIDWLQEQDLTKAEAFWRRSLKGFTSPTPIGGPRSTGQALDPCGHGEQSARLSFALTSALRALAERHDLTMNVLTQGAWALLLSHYSGEEDVVFGAARACRHTTLPDAESMVGLFINTLPVRVRVSPEMSLLDWLKELRAQHIETRAYEHNPLVKIQEWSDVPRGVPLFESLLVFENYQLNSTLRAQGGDWRNREFRLLERTNYPLTLAGYAAPELLLRISYDQRHFDDAMIARLLGHLQMLLEAMAVNPEQRLSELPRLTLAERQQMLVEWNNTRADYPTQKLLHELVEAQAARTPSAIAIICQDQRLGYQQLDSQANQLARQLRAEGVRAETRVGIMMERSVEMVVAMLGVLKAGGAYVPLDPSYPAERLSFMIEDAGLRVLLTQERLRQVITPHSCVVICLDSDWQMIAQQSMERPDSMVAPENVAYVIYTSGSTGRPKGVMISHEAICNHMLWMQQSLPLTPDDRVLQKTPFSFDASVWEYYAPLLAGAQLVLAAPGGHQDSAYLVRLMRQEGVTVVQVVPSMLRLLVEEEGFEKCAALRRIFCGGEALESELAERCLKRVEAELYNLYGPTEATIDASIWRCEKGNQRRSVPIGRPIANTQMYVLDRQLQLAPIGATGELSIGGACLARGYLHRPGLTAEKFIPNPYSTQPGARLYRTGDLARYLPDGQIEFLGRVDHQVKVRGYRIEPGEIEAALTRHPQVREAVVLARENLPGDKRLVAYVIAEETEQPGQRLTTSGLRQHLKQELPEHMVPSTFVRLERLPLTPNGKLDRRALPAPEQSRAELDQDYVAPRTPTEELVVSIWAEVLGIEEVGAHDNFFELGGHSLLATRLISRVSEAFRVELPVRKVFESPTVAGLAAQIEVALRIGRGVEAGPVVRVSREGRLPLSFAQQRLWFLDQLDPHDSSYNIPTAMRLKGRVSIKPLERALTEIIRRHEVLRTTFALVDGQPVQVISEAEAVSLSKIDLGELPAVSREAEAQRLAGEEAQRPFDLERGPLLRATLLRLAEEEHLLLLTLHHIISDGWSTALLLRELSILYDAFSRGMPSPLPELPI
ncbi:MAG TPA: amino acid adenylation domain-containing protein, partial [Pyrinomonadaceae bacterium]